MTHGRKLSPLQARLLMGRLEAAGIDYQWWNAIDCLDNPATMPEIEVDEEDTLEFERLFEEIKQLPAPFQQEMIDKLEHVCDDNCRSYGCRPGQGKS